MAWLNGTLEFRKGKSRQTPKAERVALFGHWWGACFALRSVWRCLSHSGTGGGTWFSYEQWLALSSNPSCLRAFVPLRRILKDGINHTAGVYSGAFSPGSWSLSSVSGAAGAAAFSPPFVWKPSEEHNADSTLQPSVCVGSSSGTRLSFRWVWLICSSVFIL